MLLGGLHRLDGHRRFNVKLSGSSGSVPIARGTSCQTSRPLSATPYLANGYKDGPDTGNRRLQGEGSLDCLDSLWFHSNKIDFIRSSCASWCAADQGRGLSMHQNPKCEAYVSMVSAPVCNGLQRSTRLPYADSFLNMHACMHACIHTCVCVCVCVDSATGYLTALIFLSILVCRGQGSGCFADRALLEIS